MKQMKTYTKNDFHNPEQLTRQQVGERHRLLLPEEVDGRFGSQGKAIASLFIQEIGWSRLGGSIGNWKDITYRVPLATQLPDGTVLTSNECCFNDEATGPDGYVWINIPNEPTMSDDEHFAMMNSARISQSLPPSYLDAILAAAKKPKPRIYVAGPMTGYKDYNFPAFFKASEELEKQGYEVINPAQLDIAAGHTLKRLKQLSPAEFQEFLKGAVKRDLDAIQTCEAIAMLPGWESSKGAKAELAVAQWLGLDEVYLEDAKTPYNSDERAESTSTASPMDEYLCSNERIADCGKIDMGDYSSTSTAQYAPDDPKGAAGSKKAPMDLLPPDALLEIARAMGFGAQRYGRWNFVETKVCAHTYVAAIGRHWAAYAKGEDRDKDSGLEHLAHLAANCMILMTAKQQGTLNDDRPKLK